MIRTLAWKEFREHQLVWVAMLALALGAVLGSPWALSADGYAKLQGDDFHLVQSLALIAVGAYGLVCGAMMLAGEHEGGTMPFLDGLAGRRRGVWGVKFLTGLLLVVLLGLVTALAAYLAGLETHFWAKQTWLLAMPAIAIDGLCWGLLGSALTRSTMGAVGVGAFAACLSLVFMGPALGEPIGSGTFKLAVIIRVILASGAVFLSLISFTRQDLQRTGVAGLVSKHGTPTSGSRRVLLWLIYRQVRWELLLVLVPLVVLGAVLMSGELLGVWALATLLLGVLCGTGVFAGEQRSGFERFLGDQRLPMSKFWRVKVLTGVALAVFVAALLAGIGIAAIAWSQWQNASRFNDRADAEFFRFLLTSGNAWPWLVIWLAHGFAAGLFFSLLFRKGVVALVLATLFSALQLAFWLPSLLAGGLPWWAVLVPPLVLILATRFIAWAWVTERLAAPRPVLTAASCVLLALAWQAGWLGWRAVEIPKVGEPFDLAAYRLELIAAGESKAGQLLPEAGRSLYEWDEKVTREFLTSRTLFGEPLTPDGDSHVRGIRTSSHIAGWLLRAGDEWPTQSPDYGRWLDRMFAGDWVEKLEVGLRERLGVVIPPRNVLVELSTGYDHKVYSGLCVAGHLLLARSLQLLSQGEHDRALEQVAHALAYSRHLRSHCPPYPLNVALSVEAAALAMLERYVAAVGLEHSSLDRAVRLVNDHLRDCPPVSQGLETEYYIARARVEDPQLMFSGWVAGQPVERYRHRLRLALIGAAHQVPWERERLLRCTNLLYSGYLRFAQAGPAALVQTEHLQQEYAIHHPLRNWLPPTGQPLDHSTFDRQLRTSWLVHVFGAPRFQVYDQLLACRRTATQTKLAIWRYQADEGKFPDTLESLTPKYLPTAHLDPLGTGLPEFQHASPGLAMQRSRALLAAAGQSEFQYTTIPPGDGILRYGRNVSRSSHLHFAWLTQYIDAIWVGPSEAAAADRAKAQAPIVRYLESLVMGGPAGAGMILSAEPARDSRAGMGAPAVGLLGGVLGELGLYYHVPKLHKKPR
jgi:hypothetical protein